jgi:zinc transporter 1/2/3
MDLFAVKLIMFGTIFLFGMAGGTLPRILGEGRHGETLLTLGSGFAGGVFLGAGVIHLLGDSHEFFAEAAGKGDYPYFLLVGGIGFLIVLMLEKVLVRADEGDAANSNHPYILLAVLSLHSMIAGTALGLESELSGALVLLLAVVAHKSFAAFALGLSFRQGGLARRRYFSLLLLFSLTTPLGVLIGASLNNFLQSEIALELEAVFDGLAGGTFIYVASMDVIGHEFDDGRLRWAKFTAVALGFGLMALLAIWA